MLYVPLAVAQNVKKDGLLTTKGTLFPLVPLQFPPNELGQDVELLQSMFPKELFPCMQLEGE